MFGPKVLDNVHFISNTGEFAERSVSEDISSMKIFQTDAQRTTLRVCIGYQSDMIIYIWRLTFHATSKRLGSVSNQGLPESVCR